MLFLLLIQHRLSTAIDFYNFEILLFSLEESNKIMPNMNFLVVEFGPHVALKQRIALFLGRYAWRKQDG